MADDKVITLKKGQACTVCRRRKTRCDGQRPICTQCAVNGRELDCEYADGLRPTRTEVLQNYLQRLNIHVESLERRHAEKGDPRKTRPPKTNLNVVTKWWNSEVPPPYVANTLLDTFCKNGLQVGWVLHTPTFMASLKQPRSSPEYPHLALLDTIYLWGAHLSPGITSHEAENALLMRATGRLQTQDMASQSVQHGLHIIQAEILLSAFMFSVGAGNLETDYRVSAAVRLALAFGMNRISRQTSGHAHEEERIFIFWAVFCLDRMWAIANGKPANLSVRGKSRTVITTPWPRVPGEHGQVQVAPVDPYDEPLRRFYEEHGNSSSGFSSTALYVKSAFVCEYAAQHTSLPTSDPEVRRIDSMIFTYVSSLSPLESSAPAAVKSLFLSIHAVGYLAFIKLHENNAPTDAGAYSRCVQAARYIAMLPRQMAPAEMTQLDPYSLPCFVISSKVIMREASRMRQTSPETPGYTPPQILMDELNRLMTCLEILESIYPVLISQLDSLRTMRANFGL